MSTFVIEEIEEFKKLATTKMVSKLKRDKKCLYDDFLKDIKMDKNLVDELDDLTALIEGAAILKEHPKYKKLKSASIEGYPVFEAKSKHLRLYVTEEHKPVL